MSETRFRNFCANFVIVSILLLVFGVSFVAAYPVEEKIEQVNNAVYNGKTDCGKIALTFNVYERATKNLKAGDIILMHPTDATVTALPKILEYIKSQNLKADVVSKVI